MPPVYICACIKCMFRFSPKLGPDGKYSDQTEYCISVLLTQQATHSSLRLQITTEEEVRKSLCFFASTQSQDLLRP